MRGVNRVMLIGNLGKDPDVQFLEGNIGVAKFPLATTETFKDRTGKLVSQTEWHTVYYGGDLPNSHKNIYTKAALFILKDGLEPGAGKIKKATASLLRK